MTPNIKTGDPDKLSLPELPKGVQKRNVAKVSHLLEIGQDCAKHFKEPFRSTEHGDLLYDEKGLPK